MVKKLYPMVLCRKVVSGLMAVVFIAGSVMPARAQGVALARPGEMVHLSGSFQAPALQGIKVYPDNPFRFDFLVDKGNVADHPDRVRDDALRLIKYFLTTLTIPAKDLWVNLSPYERNRIIPEAFGLTEMGRDMLAQDYILKQVTASLMDPEGKTGKVFWDKIYAEAFKRYGVTDVPVDTFNKVWIMPDKAVVDECNNMAFLVEGKLKVMVEADYVAQEKNSEVSGAMEDSVDKNKLGVAIIREIIIPVLTQEINEGKNFAPLRQVYHSLILATWYKRKIKESLLGKVYVDRNKISGVNLNVRNEKERIYARYIEAFKNGVYNFIKEEYDPATQAVIPRKYFSGGEEFTDRAMDPVLQVRRVDAAGVVMDMAAGDFSTVVVAMKPTRDSIGQGKSGQSGNEILFDQELLISKYKEDLLPLVGISWDKLPLETKILMQRFPFDQFLLVAQSVRSIDTTLVGYFFEFGLPMADNVFETPSEFKSFCDDLVSIVLSSKAQQRRMRVILAFANVRRGFKTAEDFNFYWPELVKALKSAGPDAEYLIPGYYGSLRRLFKTRDEFEIVNNSLLELAKAGRSSASELFENVVSFAFVIKYIKDINDLEKYTEKMKTILSFMDEDQMSLFSNLSRKSQVTKAILGSWVVKNRYEFVTFLLGLSLEDEEVDRVIVVLLEAYVFSNPEELTVDIIRGLYDVCNDEQIKYFLYFITTREGVPSDVKRLAVNYIQDKKLFKLHATIAEQLKTGKKKMLVVHNINDGQGDELIRMTTLIQSFLDFNPELEVTVITARPYLYDHPRVRVRTFVDLDNYQYLSRSRQKAVDVLWGRMSRLFQKHYDVVIDHYNNQPNNGSVESLLQESKGFENAFLYIKTNKGKRSFGIENVFIDSNTYGPNSLVGGDSNVYEQMFKLAAELGLPLTHGEKERSLFTAKPYVKAQNIWKALMLKAGNEIQGNQYKSPVVVVNPFGGESKEKGFEWENEEDRERFLTTITDIVTQGYKVVVLPNGTTWGTYDIAVKFLDALPDNIRHHCVVADEPAIDPRLFKYYVEYSDDVWTVEGGMMHLAYNMGKSFRLDLISRRSEKAWVPNYRTSRQTIVEKVGDMVSAFQQKRAGQNLDKGGVDLNVDKLDLQVKHSDGVTNFSIDPAMVARLQDISGITPVIMNIQTTSSVIQFLQN